MYDGETGFHLPYLQQNLSLQPCPAINFLCLVLVSSKQV